MTYQISFKHLVWIPVFLLAACIKTEIIPEVLEPELSVSPAAVSLLPGGTATLNAVYTDSEGQPRPELIFYYSAGPAVAEVSSAGVVTAKAPGQTWIVATAAGLADSVLVTVASDNNAVARVEITGAPASLNTGATVQLQARAYNMNNQELNGQTFTWASSNGAVLSVDANGKITGGNSGTAAITATAAGIQSLPVTIQVLPAGGLSRSGQFSGNSGYTVSGTATLQQTGNELTLTLGSNFSSGNGPMLGVYLAKNASGGLNTQNSLKLDNLKSNSGMQTYPVPAGVGLQDYDYVVIYCIPFNVRFGTAKLD
ncbi:MAG: DM13 domain-containing protein [Thermoanaerobaculia bacterium]|nr:DM13 domain-containing protein [Thermoanaerobaculia bacterium]